MKKLLVGLLVLGSFYAIASDQEVKLICKGGESTLAILNNNPSSYIKKYEVNVVYKNQKKLTYTPSLQMGTHPELIIEREVDGENILHFRFDGDERELEDHKSLSGCDNMMLSVTNDDGKPFSAYLLCNSSMIDKVQCFWLP